MNKTEYQQWIAFYLLKIQKAKDNIETIKNKYIESNAPYPIGSIVTVADTNKSQDLRITGYDIKEGVLIPRFETVEGKNVFVSRPVIIE